MRNQGLPKHFVRDFTDVLRRFDHLHSAFESILEGPLPSSTSVDLRFDRQSDIRTNSSCGEVNISEFTRDCFGFVGRRRDFPTRGGNAEFLEQLFGLVLVNIHRAVASKALKCPHGNRNSVRMAAHDETAAKIDKALANKQLIEPCAKTIRDLLAGAPSDLYARAVDELVDCGAL